jgi:salicylate hydroxylase
MEQVSRLRQNGELSVGRNIRVAIIGAGLGGLAAAGALRQRGIEVAVYERAPALGEVGAGIQLGPNAVKVLRALGLESSLRRLAAEPANYVSLAWNDAHLRYREPMKGPYADRYGAPYLMAHRADLHRLLCGLVADDTVKLGKQCIGVSSMGPGATAEFADGLQVEADVIVGADGINSTVRQSLFGEAPARFTQQMAWRCMVPIECVPTHVGIGRDEYVGWIGPDGHVICYPIAGGALYNIFAGHVTDQWVDESWAVASSVEELLEGYRSWHPALLDMLGHVSDCYKWGIRDRDPLPRWTSGAITLLGDAAHPMMPTLAQGAAISLEDGFALARHLANHADDPGRGLVAYEAERRPRASRVVLQAREQFQNNRMNPAPLPLPRDWIFAHDVTADAAPAA